MALSLQALSPWPDSTFPAQRAAAIARLKAAVAGAAEDSDERACSLGLTAATFVEKTAPGAPQAIKDEATIRFAGYLAQSDFGGVRSEQVGEVQFEHQPNHGMMFRNSGAGALLSPWKIRRAMVAG